MMKSIVSAAVLSLSIISAAWALPVPSASQVPQAGASDLVLVGKKGHGGKNWNRGRNYNKNWKHHGRNYNRNWNRGGKWRGYHHRGRYWGHRYYYRPWNWNVLGCINVGPVWYCP
jgi:hypothetical protein